MNARKCLCMVAVITIAIFNCEYGIRLKYSMNVNIQRLTTPIRPPKANVTE